MDLRRDQAISAAISEFDANLERGLSAIEAAVIALSKGLDACAAAILVHNPRTNSLEYLAKHTVNQSVSLDIDLLEDFPSTMNDKNKKENRLWQSVVNSADKNKDYTLTTFSLKSENPDDISYLVCCHTHPFQFDLENRNFISLIAIQIESQLRSPAILDREKQTHDLLDLSPNAIVVQAGGKVVYVNQAAIKIYSANHAHDLIGMNMSDLIAPEMRKMALENRKRIIEGTSKNLNVEIDSLSLDGSVFHSEASISRGSWRGSPATINIFRDITARKIAEATAQRRDAELALAQELAKIGHWRIFPDTGELDWSEELYRIYGMDPQTTTITRTLARSMKLSADNDLFSRILEQAVDGDANSSFEYKIIRKDGSIRLLRGNAQPEFGPDGNLISVFGVSQDITDQKETKIALDASKDRFKDLAELGADWFWEMDEQLRFSYFSDETHRVTGLPTARYIGKTREDMRPHDINDDLWAHHLNDLINHRPFKDFKYKHRSETGKIFHWTISGKPVFDKEGNFMGYRGTGYDRTSHVKLEEKLIQSQKMEAVGQLTGGIAHDFNNILAVIQGNLELLQEATNTRPEIDKNYINTALRVTARGAELTRSMLAFSRKQDLHPKSIQLNEQVHGMTKILERTLGETIAIKIKCDDNLWACTADPGQVENALLNLAINARDAMPDGGTLTIEARNVFLNDDYASAQTELEPGDYLLLAISDTGTGISPEDLQHVFEPFYTTKDIGKGTGLGLSMVYGFAKQSGGHTNIYSELGIGTTVKIYLPKSEKINAEAPVEQYETTNIGDKIILVVEDDPDMRTLAVALLSSMGYRIREAKDGPAALMSVLKEGPVDLLLTDVVLPGGLNGVELSEKITKLHPEVKTLFMSGYTEDAFSGNKLLNKEAVLLQKPFRKYDLAAKILLALDA